MRAVKVPHEVEQTDYAFTVSFRAHGIQSAIALLLPALESEADVEKRGGGGRGVVVAHR